MNTAVNSVRLIEKFIEGTIEKEENRILQKKLESDLTLQREFLLRQEIERMFQDNEIYQLRSNLNLAYISYKGEDQKPGNKNLKRFFYAAAAISGVAVGGVVVHSLVDGKMDAGKLYSENFRPYPAITTYRSGREATSDSRFFRAMLAYKNGDYKSAIADFGALMNEGTSDFAVQFYMGVSLMEVHKFNNARVFLKRVADSNSLLKDQANWYCALCYLGENKVADAKIILMGLKEGNGQLNLKASELLTQLPGN